jgi:hypothetical protein
MSLSEIRSQALVTTAGISVSEADPVRSATGTSQISIADGRSGPAANGEVSYRHVPSIAARTQLAMMLPKLAFVHSYSALKNSFLANCAAGAAIQRLRKAAGMKPQ